MPKDVGDLEAGGREVEHFRGVAPGPCLSERVLSSGLGKLVPIEEQHPRRHLRVRHPHGIDITVQLQRILCRTKHQSVKQVREHVSSRGTILLKL